MEVPEPFLLGLLHKDECRTSQHRLPSPFRLRASILLHRAQTESNMIREITARINFEA